MNNITILTGAGISTAAGIPDFRGNHGLWTLHPEMQNIFDYQQFMSKPKVRTAAWAWMHDDASMNARKPTAAHYAITRLQESRQLLGLYTQNIDSLHEYAGTKDVVHMHGVTTTSHCQRCGQEYDTQIIMDHLDQDPDPHCHQWNQKKQKECGGVIKMDVVYFGENLDKHLLKKAHDAMFRSDEFWAVGTSLTVFPVADLMREAIALGKRTVIVNGSHTPFDDKADKVIVPCNLIKSYSDWITGARGVMSPLIRPIIL